METKYDCQRRRIKPQQPDFDKIMGFSPKDVKRIIQTDDEYVKWKIRPKESVSPKQE